MIIEFEKAGHKFSFKNPKWDSFNNNLTMEYKIVGVHESKYSDDGYFANSVFDKRNGSMSLYNVNINGKKYSGVILPQDILEKVTSIYEELKEKDIQQKLNMDIEYTLNDTTSYGIYNGISEFDISLIVSKICASLNSYISSEEIAEMLTEDEEIKKIAEETYVPYPQNENWSDEYKKIYQEEVKNKTAAGYGLIPNKIIKEKITNIILKHKAIEESKIKKEQQRVNKLFDLAKSTGEKQLINQWTEPCNDPLEECNLDICCEYAMPDGTKKYTRNHTW